MDEPLEVQNDKIADPIMSFDNIVAIAAMARGNISLSVGLLLSIPFLVWALRGRSPCGAAIPRTLSRAESRSAGSRATSRSAAPINEEKNPACDRSRRRRPDRCGRGGRVPHVSRLSGPGVALCCSDAQLRRLLGSAAGTTPTERNPAYKTAAFRTPAPLTVASNPAGNEWPSYNRTLTSERYSPLAEINAKTVGQLKVLCTYDTKQYTSFETGLIVVNGALIGTTRTDIFSIDPATCAENWRTREDFSPSYNTAMQGAAYFDSMLFRGSPDGQVLAYDFKTGSKSGRRQSLT